MKEQKKKLNGSQKERTVPPTLMRDYGERHGHASGVGESKRVSVAVAHVQQKYRRKFCVETREDYRKDWTSTNTHIPTTR